MIGRLTEARTTLYAEPHRDADVVTLLEQGDLLRVDDRQLLNTSDWTAISLLDARGGYVPSTTAITPCPVMELDQDTSIHQEPSASSPVLASHGAGARV